MEMPKDIATLDPDIVESRAMVLCAMDVLMHHLNEEEMIDGWLENGVPDGAPPLRLTTEQIKYYSQFVDDFEEMTKIFARIVRRVCFSTRYEPRGFC